MKIYEIPSHVFVSKVENHKEIKQNILDTIKSMGQYGVENRSQKITNTDWHLDSNIARPYYDIIKPALQPHLELFSEKMGFDKISVSNYWYQQYNEGDYHLSHVHPKAMFSNVYYIQLDDKAPKTTFTYLGESFDIQVEEGSIITFPTYLSHESKPNKSTLPKIIIAFNIDADIGH